MQALFTGSDTVTDAFNVYYGGTHFLVPAAALALYPVVRHRALRVLVAAYPVMTTLVVVATGNHYFLDAVAGTLLAGLTWAVVSRLTRAGADAAGAAGGHRGQVVRDRPVLLPEPAGHRGADLGFTTGGHEGHDRAAEPAAGHAGPEGAVVDRGLDGRVGLRPGHPEPVAERTVRRGQQIAHRRLVAGPQQLGDPQDAAVLGDDVLAYAPQGRVG